MTKAPPHKVLILDGIGGVPLGREICATFAALGISATHVDCLQQRRRLFYPARSALAKAKNKHSNRDGFYLLPKLVETDLKETLAREQPSHILVVGFIYKFYTPSFVKRVANAHNARLLLYDTDSCNLFARRREFVFFIENELPIYNRIFSFSQITTRFLHQSRNLDAVYLPFGANPIKTGSSTRQIGALFIGSCDLRRIFLLESVRDVVTVRGNRWRRNAALMSEELAKCVHDTPVWGEELHELLASAKIVLNITRGDFYAVETGINLRVFEALAAGSFLLTDHSEEVADLFRIGIDIETYRSASELLEKVKYYLHNDDERIKIARNGHEQFLQTHTWLARIEKEMLPQMEI